MYLYVDDARGGFELSRHIGRDDPRLAVILGPPPKG